MNKLQFKHLGWTDRTNLIEILSFIADKNLIDNFSISIKDLLLKLSKEIPSHYLIENLAKLVSKHKIYEFEIQTMKNNEIDKFNEFRDNISKSWEKK